MTAPGNATERSVIGKMIDVLSDGIIIDDILKCWELLDVPLEINTRKSAETMYLVLYLFFSLFTDGNTNALKEIQDKDKLSDDELKTRIIEACLLSPVFAALVAIEINESIIGSNIKVHKDGMKEFNKNFNDKIKKKFGNNPKKFNSEKELRCELAAERVASLIDQVAGELLNLVGVDEEPMRWLDQLGIWCVLKYNPSGENLLYIANITTTKKKEIEISIKKLSVDLMKNIDDQLEKLKK